MPLTSEQKIARAARRKAKRAMKNTLAKKSAKVVKEIVGSGAYKPRNTNVPRKRVAGIPRVGGKGGFFSDMWSGVKDAVRFAPEAINTFRAVAPLLSGFGAYKVNHNTFLNNQSNMESGFPTNQAPSFSSAGVGSDIIFSHREYVKDITSSVDFTKNSYVLNPGNPTLFPWLSQIASLYEEYQFLGVVLEFKSMSATAVGTTSSAMGAVVMATDYDCEDANFANKRAMEAAEYATSGQPFESFIHPIECDPKRNPIPRLYVVPGITTVAGAPGDPRFSIHGVTTLATVGQQLAGTAIGELWVSYHVRLSRPVLEHASANNFSQHIWGACSTIDTALVIGNTSNGTGFTCTLAGNGSTRVLNCLLPANSLLTQTTFQVSMIAQQPIYGAWTPPANVHYTYTKNGTGTTTFPVICSSGSTGEPNTISAAVGTTANTAGVYGPNNSYTSSCIVTVHDAEDGFNIFIPSSEVNASTFDIYISTFNTDLSVAAPKATKASGVSRLELDAMMKRLAKLEVKTSNPAELIQIEEQAAGAAASSSSSDSLDDYAAAVANDRAAAASSAKSSSKVFTFKTTKS